MRIVFSLLMVAACFCFASCATIIDGTSADVNFTSDPSGATIFVDGVQKGTTPAVVKLSKSDQNTVILKKSGYQDAVVPIQRKFAGWTLGNLVLGGVIGIVVDVVTGAVQRVSPTTYNAKLNK